jgi:hypothetical protein
MNPEKLNGVILEKYKGIIHIELKDVSVHAHYENNQSAVAVYHVIWDSLYKQSLLCEEFRKETLFYCPTAEPGSNKGDAIVRLDAVQYLEEQESEEEKELPKLQFKFKPRGKAYMLSIATDTEARLVLNYYFNSHFGGFNLMI